MSYLIEFRRLTFGSFLTETEHEKCEKGTHWNDKEGKCEPLSSGMRFRRDRAKKASAGAEAYSAKAAENPKRHHGASLAHGAAADSHRWAAKHAEHKGYTDLKATHDKASAEHTEKAKEHGDKAKEFWGGLSSEQQDKILKSNAAKKKPTYSGNLSKTAAASHASDSPGFQTHHVTMSKVDSEEPPKVVSTAYHHKGVVTKASLATMFKKKSEAPKEDEEGDFGYSKSPKKKR